MPRQQGVPFIDRTRPDEPADALEDLEPRAEQTAAVTGGKVEETFDNVAPINSSNP